MWLGHIKDNKQMKEKEILTQISERLGIETLNPMQKAMAEAARDGSPTLLLLAPTGSGKTVAFTLAMLGRLGPADGETRAVVIVPSRELAMQIGRVVGAVARGYRVATFYGGHSMADEASTLTVTPDIVIATPGRLLDHLNRRQIDLRGVRVLVLDEFDKSLELGFSAEMERLVRAMKGVRTLILTSATRAADYPPYINVKGARTLDFTAGDEGGERGEVKKYHLTSWEKDKLPVLGELLERIGGDGPALVFVNHRESAERVWKSLRRSKIPVGLYHGGLEQRDRENALEMFRNGTTPVLVTTDLAARGLDIPTVASVIHYHLPPSPEAWTHRNGRTGRLGGVDGKVYVITSEDETIPDEVSWNDEFHTGRNDRLNPPVSDTATLYFNVGKREKISRGDIVGFLTAKCGLDGKEIGRIALSDHSALVAVPAAKAAATIEAAAPHKIKNKRARISRLLPGVK